MSRVCLALSLALCTLAACAGPRQPAAAPGAAGTAQAGAGPVDSADAGADAGDDTLAAAGQGEGQENHNAAAVPVYDLEGMRIEVAGRTAEGEPELVSYDAQSLLDEGNQALADERFDAAAARYEQLLRMFPDSRLVPDALYNLGLSYELRDQPERALAMYRQVGDLAAELRSAAVLAEYARWSEARRVLERAAEREQLTAAERIEVFARLGYVALSQEDDAAAELALGEALADFDALTAAPADLYYPAMARYYLAQIPHRQLQRLTLRLPDAQLQRDLENKSELLALAYDRYRATLDIHHLYWATAAGYQMSQIYKEFWDDVIAVPVPPQLAPEAAQFYRREVHERVRPMLEKALDGHLRNLDLADAYGQATEWSRASRVRADEIARLLMREHAGELVSPPGVTPNSPRAADDAQEPDSRFAPERYVPGRFTL